MSGKLIDYYLTMNSPWSYMGAARLEKLAAETGARVHVYPVKVAGVFAATGGLPLAKRAPERQAYRLVELRRWADFLNLPINLEPAHFPADDTLAAQAVIAARENGLDALGLSRELGRAQWELEQNYARMETVAAACARAGIEVAALGDIEQYADVFEKDTRRAVARGVFGFPTYIVDDELFWGQDRLDFLGRAL